MLLRAAVLIVAIVLTLASASAAVAAAVTSHRWKMVAVEDGSLRFVDIAGLAKAGTIRSYWELTVPDSTTAPATTGTYTLISWNADCSRGTLSPLGATRYHSNAEPQEVIAPRPPQHLTPPPESVGERELSFVCTRSDKYRDLTAQESISAAIAWTRLHHAEVLSYNEGRLALSDAELISIAREFDDAQTQSGMMGVSKLVQGCFEGHATHGKHRSVVYCAVLDAFARNIDTAISADISRAAGQTEATEALRSPYFEDQAYKLRMRSYLLLLKAQDDSILTPLVNKVSAALSKLIDSKKP